MNNNDLTGGVYCKVCNTCLSQPRKRKYIREDCFIICDECEDKKIEKYKTMDDIVSDPDIADIFYLQTMNCINKTVCEYIDREEIKHDIWNAVHDGVHTFLTEYYESIVQEVTNEIKENLEDKIKINFKVVRDD